MLPIAFGIKDPALIAITFTCIWILYTIFLLIHTFLIAGRRNMKERREELENDMWGFS
jgi:hypothetical protein